MKKTLFFCYFLVVSYWIVDAQECTYDSIGISTNPLSPINPERPELANTFNWMLPHMNAQYVLGMNPPNIPSPYWNNNAALTSYLGSMLLHPEKIDFYPEDGWELLHWGWGVLQNGTAEAPQSNYERQTPYFILYNRYTGLLHVFGVTTLPEAYNALGVQLEYFKENQNSVTGLFSQNNAVARPLDQKTAITKLVSYCEASNEPRRFFHVSFQMAYDPCVCQSPTSFTIQFRGVQTATLELVGHGVLMKDPIDVANVNPNGTVGFYDKFMANISYQSNDPVGALTLYKTADAALLQSMHDASGFNYQDLAKKLELLSKAAEFGGKAVGGKDAIGAALKGVGKVFSVASMAFKEIEPRNTVAAIWRQETYMKGEAVSQVYQNVSRIAVPGSQGSSSLPEANYPSQPYYPYYNEKLGVFSVLKTPVVRRTYEHHFHQRNGVGFINSWFCNHFETTEKLRLQLSPEVVFAFNPAARVNQEKTKIHVAIVVKPKNYKTTTTWGTGAVSDQLTSFNMEPVMGGDYRAYISPMLPIECLSNLVIGFDRELETECNYDNAPEGFHSLQTDSVYLRFLIEYEFTTHESNGQPRIGAQIFTYPVKIEDIPIGALQLSPSLPFDLTVDVGNLPSTDIRAWNTITLVGTMSQPTSQPISIIAGSSIDITSVVSGGNIDIFSELNMSIMENPLGNCNDERTMPADIASIQNFCGSVYSASQMQEKLAEPSPPLIATSLSNDSTAHIEYLPFRTYPNPFDESLTVEISADEAENGAVIRVVDVLGREVGIWQVPAGETQVVIPTSAWQAGVYIATCGTHTAKVVKSR